MCCDNDSKCACSDESPLTTQETGEDLHWMLLRLIKTSGYIVHLQDELINVVDHVIRLQDELEKSNSRVLRLERRLDDLDYEEMTRRAQGPLEASTDDNETDSPDCHEMGISQYFHESVSAVLNEFNNMLVDLDKNGSK